MSSLRSVMRASESEISLYFLVAVLSDHFFPQEEEDIWGRTRKKKKKCSPPIALQHAGGRCTDTRVELLSEYKRLI